MVAPEVVVARLTITAPFNAAVEAMVGVAACDGVPEFPEGAALLPPQAQSNSQENTADQNIIDELKTNLLPHAERENMNVTNVPTLFGRSISRIHGIYTRLHGSANSITLCARR